MSVKTVEAPQVNNKFSDFDSINLDFGNDNFYMTLDSLVKSKAQSNCYSFLQMYIVWIQDIDLYQTSIEVLKNLK